MASAQQTTSGTCSAPTRQRYRSTLHETLLKAFTTTTRGRMASTSTAKLTPLERTDDDIMVT